MHPSDDHDASSVNAGGTANDGPQAHDPELQYGSQYGPQFGPQFGSLHGDPAAEPDSVAEPEAGRRRTVLTAGAGVVVLAAAAVSIVFLSRGHDTPHGAASPQAGTEQLASLVARQDVDGILALVDPAESRSLRVFVDQVRDVAENTGAVRATGVPLPFLSLSIDKLTTKTDQKNDSLAFVTVTGGNGKSVVDRAKLPPGLRGDATGTETDIGDVADGLHRLRLGFVKVDDGWYFSPTTTALEAARANAGLPEPTFTALPAPRGGSSPEAAVRGLITTSARGDVKAAASYVSSAELPALRYYAGVLARRLNSSSGQQNVTISGLDLATTNLSNGLRKVTVKALTVSSPDGDRVTYRDGCIEGPGGRQCLDAPGAPPALRQVAATPPAVVTEKIGDSWQVSPFATVVESGRAKLADNGGRATLLRSIDAYALAPVTSRLEVGSPASVKLNNAGFAHAQLRGRATQCVESSGDVSVRPLGPVSPSDSCDGFVVPRSGVVDVAVIAEQERARTVTVTIRAK